jgi:hypothetical protein
MVSQGGSGVVSVKNHWQVLIIYWVAGKQEGLSAQCEEAS